MKISDIWKDVTSYTHGVLKLENKSYPYPKTEEEYLETINNMGETIEENEVAIMNEVDQSIYINSTFVERQKNPDGLYIAIIAGSQVPAFFLENTDYGRRVAKTAEERFSMGGNTKNLWEEMNCFSIYGISTWVGIETGKFLRNRGYKFEIENEMIEEAKKRKYFPAFEICEKIWKEANPDKIPDSNEIIRRSIQFSQSSDNFDREFLKLINYTNEELHSSLGYSVLIKKPVGNIEKILAEISQAITFGKTRVDIISYLTSLEEELKHFGQEELRIECGKIHNLIESGLGMGESLNSLPSELFKTYQICLSEFLNHVKNSIERHKEKPNSIILR